MSQTDQNDQNVDDDAIFNQSKGIGYFLVYSVWKRFFFVKTSPQPKYLQDQSKN